MKPKNQQKYRTDSTGCSKHRLAMADIQDLSKLDHMCAWLMCGEACFFVFVLFRRIQVEVEITKDVKKTRMDAQGTKVSVIVFK